MARMIAFPGADGTLQVWINPPAVRTVHQNGQYVVVSFDDQHQQLIRGEADAVVSKLNSQLDP